ncbi:MULTISPECIES: hypothetical protein [Thioclava]|uniref:hypothetical protein n=1 Tax=Thioclava TaxID=285107 RepID=UPI000B53F5E8|nr:MULTISPECIES: hypothetical protein [Thioclava]OWX96951.1 hypothetical protein B6V76_19430 [Thioclava sp. IC9]WGT50413.1 hypothetical protein P0N61_19300 [Thioclava nitratireducens]
MDIYLEEDRADPVISRRMVERALEGLDMKCPDDVKTATERVRGFPLPDLYLSSSLGSEGNPHEAWIARMEIDRQAAERLRAHEFRVTVIAALAAIIGGAIGGGLHILWP